MAKPTLANPKRPTLARVGDSGHGRLGPKPTLVNSFLVCVCFFSVCVPSAGPSSARPPKISLPAPAAHKLPGFHMTPKSPKRAPCVDLGLEPRPQFHEKTTIEREGNEIGGEEGKKTRDVGLSTLRPPLPTLSLRSLPPSKSPPKKETKKRKKKKIKQRKWKKNTRALATKKNKRQTKTV